MHPGKMMATALIAVACLAAGSGVARAQATPDAHVAANFPANYAATSAATPAATPAATSAAIADALDVAREWAELVGQGNVAGLETLLSDQYLHIHGTALIESKQQFLDAFRSNARSYDPIRLEQLNVRVFPGFAEVTGLFELTAHAPGKTFAATNLFQLVVVKTASSYQVASFQATVVPKKK